MSSIAAISFFKMTGTVKRLSSTLKRIDHPTADGQSYKRMGKKGGPRQLTTISFLADDTALTTLEANIAALISTLQTIVDGQGTTTPSVMILDGVVNATKILGTNTSSSKWMATTQWEVQATV